MSEAEEGWIDDPVEAEGSDEYEDAMETTAQTPLILPHSKQLLLLLQRDDVEGLVSLLDASPGEAAAGMMPEQASPSEVSSSYSDASELGSRSGGEGSSRPSTAAQALSDLTCDMDIDRDDSRTSASPLDLTAQRVSEYISANQYINYGFGGEDLFSRNTLLYVACQLGSIRCAVVLMMRGADVNVISMEGGSPLHLSCVRGEVDLVRWLLEYEASVNMVHDLIEGDTALLATVACYGTHPEYQDCYLAIAKLLLDHGADLKLGDRLGVTPLHVAVKHHNTRMTKLLLSYGADVNYQGHCVMSPLMRAVSAGSLANLQLLLSSGCQVNATCSTMPSQSALALAVDRNHMCMVLDLLAAGAKPSLGAADAHPSAMHMAANSQRLLLLLLLVTYGGDVDTRSDIDKAPLLLTLTRQGCMTGVKLLLRLGANPNLTNQLHTTPLWAAVSSGHEDLVRVFLATNCCVDSYSLERFLYRPMSPLQLALLQKQPALACLLLQAGCIMFRKDLQLYGSGLTAEDRASLLTWVTEPCALKQLCRQHLRRQYRLKLPSILHQTSYPRALKQYILCQAPWIWKFNLLRPRQNGRLFPMTFSDAFSWMKVNEFRLRFHWSLFLRVQLPIFQHWFR